MAKHWGTFPRWSSSQAWEMRTETAEKVLEDSRQVEMARVVLTVSDKYPEGRAKTLFSDCR